MNKKEYLPYFMYYNKNNKDFYDNLHFYTLNFQI